MATIALEDSNKSLLVRCWSLYIQIRLCSFYSFKGKNLAGISPGFDFVSVYFSFTGMSSNRYNQYSWFLTKRLSVLSTDSKYRRMPFIQSTDTNAPFKTCFFLWCVLISVECFLMCVIPVHQQGFRYLQN